MVEKVKREIEKDCQKTIRDVADSTDIWCRSEHKILRKNLEMKVYSKLGLIVLTTEQKKEQVFVVETFLNDCDADPTLLVRIITGDESQVYPSTKCQSVLWKRSDKPQHKKAGMAQSQYKLMLILFFDIQGVVMAECVPYLENVDAAFQGVLTRTDKPSLLFHCRTL